MVALGAVVTVAVGWGRSLVISVVPFITTACEVSKFFPLKETNRNLAISSASHPRGMNTQAQSKALLPKGPRATKSGERFDCDLCCRE